MLFLPEGRAGVAWEPSKNNALSPPSENEVSLTSTIDFLFCIYSSFILPISLSLSKGFLNYTTSQASNSKQQHNPGYKESHVISITDQFRKRILLYN
jgi:hypothetical protein